jgi:hypothetical protein
MAKFDVPEGWCVQAFRFALDPTEDQARSLARHFGARRKAYNWAVATLKAVPAGAPGNGSAFRGSNAKAATVTGSVSPPERCGSSPTAGI